jgi:hypothetical protein
VVAAAATADQRRLALRRRSPRAPPATRPTTARWPAPRPPAVALATDVAGARRPRPVLAGGRPAAGAGGSAGGRSPITSRRWRPDVARDWPPARAAAVGAARAALFRHHEL